MNQERTFWLEAAAVLLAGLLSAPLAGALFLVWRTDGLPLWVVLALSTAGWLTLRAPLLAAFGWAEAAKLTAAAAILHPPAADALLGLWYQGSGWLLDLLAGISLPPPAGTARVLGGAAALLAGGLAAREATRTGAAPLTLAGAVALFGLVWLLGYDEAQVLFLRFLPPFLLLWACGAAYARDRRWHAAGRRSHGESDLFFTALIALLLFLPAWLLPSPAQGLSLGRAGDWLRVQVPVLQWLRGGTGGPAGYAGFSLTEVGLARRAGELGGPALLSDEVALRVGFPSGAPERPLYLRGRSRTLYTGRGWETGAFDEPPPANFPSGEPVHLAVQTVGLRSFTLFYPRELVRFSVTARFDSEENAVAGDRSYEVVALLGGSSRAHDAARYLQLPPSLPDRVREEAARIAGDRSDPADVALALEEYLRTLPYLLTVPPTPPGRDFADFFLFDLRQGYCTYSATAMAVMLRSLGIPSRWVEGFVWEPGMAEVPFRNAHAWVEVLLPERGWVLFDPTPRFPLPLRDMRAPAGAAAPDLPMPHIPGRPLPLPESEPVPARALPEAVPLALAAAVLLFLLRLLWLYRQGRIEWRDDRAAPQQAYAAAVRMLAERGLARERHLTDREYAGKAGRRWPELQEPMESLAAQATEARFSAPGHFLAGAAARARVALQQLTARLAGRRPPGGAPPPQ